MKFCLLSVFCLLLCTFITSCSNETTPTEGDTTIDKGSYTIMLYSPANGPDLDDATAHYITQAIYRGLPENVNMTVETKFTVSDNLTRLAGINRYDIADQADLKGSDLMPHTVADFSGSTKALDENIKNVEYYGDKTVLMCKGEEIKKFIQWSRDKHPADHYVLILIGHGLGWTPWYDGVSDGMASRASMCDAYDSKGDYISLDEMVSAISDGMDGQKLDVLFCNNCLMQSLENLTGYAEVANYAVAATEVTMAEGINTSVFLDRIDDAAQGRQTLFNAMASYCDYACSDQWWGRNDTYYSDLGVTDLSKMGKINAAFKQFADFADNHFADAIYGNYATFNVFEEAMDNTITNTELYKMALIAPTITDPAQVAIIDKAIADGEFPDYAQPTKTSGGYSFDNYSTRSLLAWMQEHVEESFTNDGITLYCSLYYYGAFFFIAEYVAADYMQQVIDMLSSKGFTALASEAQQIRDNYMAAVKDASHMAATNLKGAQTPYDVVSYSVNIQPTSDAMDNINKSFDELMACISDLPGDIDKIQLFVTAAAATPSYHSSCKLSAEQVYGYYQHTLFDNATGWSRFFNRLTKASTAAKAQDRKVRNYLTN